MARGRHASSSSSGFYKDLAFMVGGILLVGSIVFLGMFAFFGDGATTTTTTSLVAAPTTQAESSTTSSTSTTLTPPTISTTVPGTTSTETVPIRPPDEVRVVVLNSMGLAGAAGRLTSRLADAGYQTLPADDYEPEQDPSRIWYRDGFSPEATVLLEFLPDALVQPLPDESLQEGADVILVLGTGYSE